MKAAIINKETGKPEIVDVPIPEIQKEKYFSSRWRGVWDDVIGGI